MKKNNIVLIGFMGSGKTTAGIRLSYRFRRAMEDTDKMIEKRQKRTINEIFAEEGEEYFRQLETDLLKEAIRKINYHIIAVGGGTPVRAENRELLKQLGTVVYLRVKPETVYERLKEDTKRPLLKCENPLERITQMIDRRKDAYESCADIIVDVDNLTLTEVAERIYTEVKRMIADSRIKLLVINGPNLNFLGIREKSVYGTQNYEYLLQMIKDKAKKCRCQIETYQSNHEGAIIDRIQQAYLDGTQGIIINPGAYTHYSYAIRDALASITVPKVEVHISNIQEREEFRKISVTAPVCDLQIFGHGLDGYMEAIDFMLKK